MGMNETGVGKKELDVELEAANRMKGWLFQIF